MLVLGIFMILLVVGIVLIVLGHKNWNSNKHKFLYYHDDDLTLTGWCLSVIFGIVVFIMIFFAIGFNTEGEATLAKDKQRYEALIYKMNSEDCKDEFGLLNKSICDEIQIWNEYVSYNKVMQDNKYIGIFYPDIYDELELINLNISR